MTKIETLRQEHDLTRTQLRKLIGVTVSKIKEWEEDLLRIDGRFISILCDIFHCRHHKFVITIDYQWFPREKKRTRRAGKLTR